MPALGAAGLLALASGAGRYMAQLRLPIAEVMRCPRLCGSRTKS